MTPGIALDRAGKFAAALTLFLGSALLLAAQSNNKTKSAPPSAQNSAPAKPTAPPPKTAPGGGSQQHSQSQAHGLAGPKGPTPGGPKSPNPGNPKGPNPGGPKPPAPKSPNTVNSKTPYSPPAGATATKVAGERTVYNTPKGQVTTSSSGQVKQIVAPHGGGFAHPETMTVNRGLNGTRMVTTGVPGNRVRSYGPGRGFVERPLRAGYISRTYVYGGHSYARVYREYRYQGVVYYHYVPAYYYGPRFYTWTVTPWGAPVVYAWPGPMVAPWYGYYGAYFTPYPMYASPDLWLTDYLIAENLRLAYENQQAGNENQRPSGNDVSQGAAAPLSPEVKDQIAAEVRRQLAEEKAAAAQPPSTQQLSSPSQQPTQAAEQIPPAMSQKFFVVSSSLDLTTKAGIACSLTPGDVIERRGTTVDASGGVAAEVLSSKQGECPADSETTVQLTDLQDMHNQLREQLDSGLGVLAKNDAKGLPAGPASGARAVAEGTAEATPGAADQLASQETDASKLESDIRQN